MYNGQIRSENFFSFRNRLNYIHLPNVMKILIVSILSFIPFVINAQQINIKERLVEYNIPVDFLEHSIRNADRKFTFKYKMISGSRDGTPVTSEIEYNPTRKSKERWKLISVDGNSPEKKQIKNFNRINNPRRKEVYAEIDESSYELVVDNDQYFTYSFKYKEGSITSNRKFLEDCKGMVYISKKTGNSIYFRLFTSYPFHFWKVKICNLRSLKSKISGGYENSGAIRTPY